MQKILHIQQASSRPMVRYMLLAAVLLFSAGCLKDDDGPMRAAWPLHFQAQSAGYLDPAHAGAKATLHNDTGSASVALEELAPYMTTLDVYAYLGTANLWEDVQPLALSCTSNVWSYTGDTRQVKAGSKFFSHAPKTIPSECGISLGSSPFSSGMTLNYTVPSNPANHHDVMAGYACPDDNANPVTLMFYHPFVAVRFKMGVLGVDVSSISSVTLSGLHQTGSVTLTGGSGNTGTFAYTESAFTGSMSISQSIGGSLPTAGADVGTSMLLLPQTSTRTLTVVCNLNGGGTRTYTKTITDAWAPGNMYTYLVTLMELSFSNTGLLTTANVPYTEGPLPDLYYTSTTVASETATSYSAKAATLKFSYNGTDWYPTVSSGTDMIKTFPSKTPAGQSGGSTRPGIGTISMSNTVVNAMPETMEANQTLGTTTKGSSTEPWDLSKDTNYDGTITSSTTSNCYIVSQPGTYCFPLVFGNAIKNGSPNASSGYAKYSSVTGGKVYVSKGWGTDAGMYEITGCDVIWNDIGKVSSDFHPQLKNSNKFVQFDIPNNAPEGNLVLCVRSSAGIAWSWHIWLAKNLSNSPSAAGNYLKTKSTTSYSFLKYVLGTRTGTTLKYGTGTSHDQTRQVQLCLFANDGSACSNTVTVTQQTGSVGVPDGGVVYEFGRKDPFKLDNHSFFGTTSSTLLQAVRNPTSFYSGGSLKIWLNSSELSIANQALLWGSPVSSVAESPVSKSIPVINKSIFDPCPKGYRVPYITELGALYYVSGTFTDSQRENKSYGVVFKLNNSSDIATDLVLPYLTRLDHDNSQPSGDYLWLWTAVSVYNPMIYHFQLDNKPHTATNYYTAHSRMNNGLHILPVKEPGAVDPDPDPVDMGGITLGDNTDMGGSMTNN